MKKGGYGLLVVILFVADSASAMAQSMELYFDPVQNAWVDRDELMRRHEGFRTHFQVEALNRETGKWVAFEEIYFQGERYRNPVTGHKATWVELLSDPDVRFTMKGKALRRRTVDWTWGSFRYEDPLTGELVSWGELRARYDGNVKVLKAPQEGPPLIKVTLIEIRGGRPRREEFFVGPRPVKAIDALFAPKQGKIRTFVGRVLALSGKVMSRFGLFRRSATSARKPIEGVEGKMKAIEESQKNVHGRRGK